MYISKTQLGCISTYLLIYVHTYMPDTHTYINTYVHPSAQTTNTTNTKEYYHHHHHHHHDEEEDMNITMDNHDNDDDEDDDVYWGAGFVPLVFVEVVPLITTAVNDEQESNDLSSVFVKNVLRNLCRIRPVSLSSSSSSSSLPQQVGPHGIEIEWTKRETTPNTPLPETREKDKNDIHVQHRRPQLASGYLWWTGDNKGQPQLQQLQQQQQQTRVLFSDPDSTNHDPPMSIPVVFLPSNDPTQLDPIPCVVKAYGTPERHPVGCHNVLVTSSTLVRILPPRPPILKDPWRPMNVYHQLVGEEGHDFLPPDFQDEVLINHNPETVRALALRMSMQCSRDIRIGTTKDALLLRQQSLGRDEDMTRAIHARLGILARSEDQTTTSNSSSNSPRSIPWEASLLIHSPNHADGKTLLVQAVAKKIGCTRIHILRAGPILAKYGIYADAALESILHGILVSAAVHSHPVCILLDHLDTFMPPSLSGRSGTGDASIPVLNALAAYLRTMTRSMEQWHEFPFPLKNSFYNPGASGGGGRVLSVRLCLIGIVTCPDDGWRSVQMGTSGVTVASSTILDSLQGGRYKLPSLTAPTRFKAFSQALHRAHLVLQDEPARRRLAVLAASAGWAKGRAFQRVATALLQQQRPLLNHDDEDPAVSKTDLDQAFARVQAVYSDFADVSFQSAASDGPQDGSEGDVLFHSVGGNGQAKEALEDALALDPAKRQLLARYGLSTPTGILLYGPPGCGKTLLAKAVVRLLQSPTAALPDAGNTDDSFAVPLGGTFISMGASDLVRAEIGTSEKMLVSVFDFADKNAPSVIFLDEFQALFTERSRGGSGKLASTLLQCMDDMKRWNTMVETPHEDSSQSSTTSPPTISPRVVVLGATNTPWMVDSAFLRSGRFDRVVHVGLPTRTERTSILRVHMSRMKIKDATNNDSLGLQALCQSMAERTKGFSGADLAALCRAAAIRALNEEEEDCWIEEKHFLKALEMDVRASSDAQLVDRLLRWKP